jgi:hypothetical protein
MDPKALVVMSELWERGARLAYELQKSGFAVAVVAPASHIVKLAQVTDEGHYFHFFLRTAQVHKAIISWKPDYIFCQDDRSVYCLQKLFAKASRNVLSAESAWICNLIKLSIGDPEFYPVVASNRLTLRLAESLAIRCADVREVTSKASFERELRVRPFPVVIKIEGYSGGQGVCIARKLEEAQEAFHDFQIPLRWRHKLRVALSVLPTSLLQRLKLEERSIFLQEFIEGRNVNSSVACWEGEVLAEVNVECLRASTATGSSSVVRRIENEEMRNAVAALVSRLKLSGICGFDFIIDRFDRAWMIEINPRTTQTSHLKWDCDLFGAIRSRITGDSTKLKDSSFLPNTIALFPNELRRDPDSEYLRTAFHDLPSDHPRLVKVMLGNIESRGAWAAESHSSKSLTEWKVKRWLKPMLR